MFLNNCFIIYIYIYILFGKSIKKNETKIKNKEGFNNENDILFLFH